ncbi:hypothetical protein QE152_g6784 [Popillia japonica]|uniref:Uncharacterized protein n=1 Tax=Popillia japonica TaxID=7064 RepID=A0AAW1MHD7_POPJA
MKANWKKFSEQLNYALNWIALIAKNYQRFVEEIISSAKTAVPSGYRKEYIWNEDCNELYTEFLESEDSEIADTQHPYKYTSKWTETVEKLDFKRSSRHAWSLLCRRSSQP